MCLRTGRYLYYGLKSRQTGLNREERARYLTKMKHSNADSCRLRLFEGCLEAAPQLVFQLYVLLVDRPHIHGFQGTLVFQQCNWADISFVLIL